ncbi:MAG TPA: class I SAM-dependent methyltransferase [Vicinamibacterales bacterium]|nr:class I SAM-dependent methyltransferase [Vicinamibacterales bacterium]
MKLDEIRRHWENSAREISVDSQITPTSRDPFLGILERDYILDALPVGAACLEVGCGDAAHTVHYARRAAHVTAIDIAQGLLTAAKSRVVEAQIANVDLQRASVLDVGQRFKGRQFDCVISQRCLINLPDWQYQKEALLQIHEILADGGWLLLTEGFQEPLDALNELRGGLNLTPIKVVEYNWNLLEKEFNPFIESLFRVVRKRDYGLYLLLSRVLHPMAVAPDAPRHDGPINMAAMQLAKHLATTTFEKYSYNLFYVLQKTRTNR